MKTACRRSLVVCLMLGATHLAAAADGAEPALPKAANPTILSFMFRDAPIEYTMNMLGETWGRHIVVNDSAKDTLVRTFLRNIDCLAALKAVCHGHSLWYREDPESGIIYVQTVDEFAKGGVLSEKKFVEVVTITYPRCEDIAAAIQDAYRDMVVYTAPDLDDDDEIGDISRALDRMDQLGDRSVVMTGDANQTSFSSSGRGRSRSRRSGESIRGMENVRRYTDDIKRMDRYLDYTTRPRDVTQVQVSGGMQSGSPAPSTPLDDAPRYISQSVVHLSIVRRSNSIILRSTDRDMIAQIKETVKQLDVPRAQVLLEVRILQLDVSDEKDRDISFIVNNDSHKFGNANAGFMQNLAARNVTWTGETETRTDSGGTTSKRKSSSSETKLGPLDVAQAYSVANHSVFQLLNNHYQLRLNFLDGRGKVRSLATPSLLVADSEASRIFIGVTRYIMTGFTPGSSLVSGTGTGTQTDTTSNFESRDIGTSLVISPKIHTDGTVTLRILQENSTPADVNPVETKVGTFYEQPIKKEIITSAVVAKDGETVALGGLMQREKGEHVYKIPLLGDIPYLGALFRHTATSESDYELIVLIRPTVIMTPATASAATRSLIKENVRDRANLHEALEKTRELRRANAERRLSETNPEGTNALINAEVENKWIPTTFKELRHFANEEVENRAAGVEATGDTGND